MKDGVYEDTEIGSPQGRVISPLKDEQGNFVVLAVRLCDTDNGIKGTWRLSSNDYLG